MTKDTSFISNSSYFLSYSGYAPFGDGDYEKVHYDHLTVEVTNSYSESLKTLETLLSDLKTITNEIENKQSIEGIYLNIGNEQFYFGEDPEGEIEKINDKIAILYETVGTVGTIGIYNTIIEQPYSIGPQ